MKTLLTLALAAALPWAAHAARYQVLDTEQSEIGFQYAQMGVAMDGSFERFEGQLDFDPADPASGRAAVTVFLDSVDTGTDEGNQEVQSSTWLNVSGHPTARFETTAIRAAGEGRYEADGVFSLKGTSRNLTVPVTFVERDGVGVFEGAFPLVRGDFGVGEGAWAAPDIVAAEVGVSFTLAARPAP